MTRSQERSYKYASVRNATGDAKLARIARDWSNERIYNELGIVVRKANLREVKNATEKQRQLKNFQLARQLGYKPEVARLLKKVARSKIQSGEFDLKELAKKKKKKKKIIVDYTTRWEEEYFNENGIRFLNSKELRYDKWNELVKEWKKLRKDKLHVDSPLVDKAELINKSTRNRAGRLQEDDSYGYAVLWLAYTENITLEEAEERTIVDNWDGDLYKFAISVGN